MDEYVAYCFDEAIGTFGAYIESELAKIEGKTPAETEIKQQRVLQQLMKPNSKGAGFSDPVAMGVVKKVRDG